MIYRFAAIAIIALLGLSGCNQVVATATGVNAQIVQVLTQLGNTGVPDLQTGVKVALAATPPDTDGAQCYGTLPTNPADATTGTGALAVAAAVQKALAATQGQTVGLFTQAEVATVFQPGSAQFNWAVKVLETSCIAKVHDVNQAINSTAGIFTALPSILALSAAPAGL